MEPILLTHWRAPGDIVCMTACVRDLALSYPGKYEIHVGGTCSELWENNPHICKAWGLRLPVRIRRISVNCYDAFREVKTTKLHYLTAFHRNLGSQLGINIPVKYSKGDLHLSEQERSTRPIEHPYWVVLAGGKSDITTKIWPASRFQELVCLLDEMGVHCVQAGANAPGHQHPPLECVTNLVGKTSLREFLQLIYHSDGVICPVTFAMHVAACFDKPCVVLAGGREPWWWEAYFNSSERHFGPHSTVVKTPHRFLESGQGLDCIREAGCWKSLVNSTTSTRNCETVKENRRDGLVPMCLDQISTTQVVNTVMSYKDDQQKF